MLLFSARANPPETIWREANKKKMSKDIINDSLHAYALCGFDPYQEETGAKLGQIYFIINGFVDFLTESIENHDIFQTVCGDIDDAVGRVRIDADIVIDFCNTIIPYCVYGGEGVDAT